MKIICPACGNNKKFITPMWVRATFRFNEDGTISIMHVRQLESLEEKLVNQKVQPTIKCFECGNKVEISFTEETKQLQSLEAL